MYCITHNVYPMHCLLTLPLPHRELRELTRLQLEVERRKKLAAEVAELLRRRQRTDEEVEHELNEERVAEATAAGTDAIGLTKKSHIKGVFYIDESSVDAGDVRLRDTSGLTSVQASRRVAENLLKSATQTTQLLGTAGGRRVVKQEEE